MKRALAIIGVIVGFTPVVLLVAWILSDLIAELMSKGIAMVILKLVVNLVFAAIAVALFVLGEHCWDWLKKNND